MTLVCSVPPELFEEVGSVDGAEILPWDFRSDPPRSGELAVVMPPQFSAPWMKRLGELPGLRGVILGSAGYDHVLHLIPPGVQVANAVGVHDTATAEIALTLALSAQRDIPAFVRDQDMAEWPPPATYRSLADRRAVIVGYGGIGRALARRLLACEAQVRAVASAPRAGDEFVDTVYGIDDLAELLPAADVLFLAAPLNERTRGLIGADQLAALPDDALVVNVGRGPIVDSDALLAECETGRLRAALDVTDPEPLPKDHPLWFAPGVLISPHTGGAADVFRPRAAAYLRRQIAAMVADGSLDHVVAVGSDSSGSGGVSGEPGVGPAGGSSDGESVLRS